MYKKSLLRDYIKESELKEVNESIKVRLSRDLAIKYEQGIYDNYLKKMNKCMELINSIGIKYPSNANPKLYIYIVPDENYAQMLGIPDTFNNGKGGGKTVGAFDLDSFNYAYGVSENRCQNHIDGLGSIMSFENNVHELAHLVHSQFFNKSSLLAEGFAEVLPLYVLSLEDDFNEYKEALKNLDDKQIYTAEQLLEQERNNEFGKEALLPNKSCSFRLSYISSYLFVRGIIETIENKFNLDKQEATQYFLEMIRQSNYTNEWLIFDIADHLDIPQEELLNGKQIQMKTLERINKGGNNMEKETMLEELEELYKDLEALEKRYNDPKIKEGKTDIWSDIKYTKEQISKIENQIPEQNSSKKR